MTNVVQGPYSKHLAVLIDTNLDEFRKAHGPEGVERLLRAWGWDWDQWGKLFRRTTNLDRTGAVIIERALCHYCGYWVRKQRLGGVTKEYVVCLAFKCRLGLKAELVGTDWTAEAERAMKLAPTPYVSANEAEYIEL